MKKFLCYPAVALLTFVAAAPSAQAPGDAPPCGTSASGKVIREDSRGLTLEVVTDCSVKRRIPGLPGFGGLNVKCDPKRKQMRFYRSANRSLDYETDDAPDQKCCENKAELTFTKLKRVRQICTPGG